MKRRPLDSWRDWAGAPYRNCEVTSQVEDDRVIPDATFGERLAGDRIWTVTENDTPIARWREDDLPGFGAWLQLLLVRYHGAWHVARGALRALPGQRNAGKESGSKRTKNSKREKVLGESNLLTLRGRDPLKYIPKIARRAGCTPEYARRIILSAAVSAAEKKNWK